MCCSSKEIENILNAILVNEGVRSAMLIQPADYNEGTGNDTKTLSIVKKIKKLFPKLLSSNNYKIYQGTIISKKSYDDKDKVISLENMGEILDYPCFNDFETLNRDEPLFALELIVSYNDTSYNDKEIPLFTNICKDKKIIDKFNVLSAKAFRALTNEKNKGILNEIKINKINKIYVNIENIIPTQYIINKLMTKKKLSDEEIKVITNIFYNMGFSDKLLEYEIQYNNPIHKGILLDLLLKDKYDVLSPFYPLQKYPEQKREVDKITIELENALIDILDKTKTKISKTKRTSIYNALIDILDKTKTKISKTTRINIYNALIDILDKTKTKISKTTRINI